jgi:alcohol dehydrogenase class IV
MKESIKMINQFFLPVKVLFGPGSLNKVGEEARACGRKALIVTYPDIRKLGFLDRVLGDLQTNGLEAEVFEDLELNPRTSTIDKAAQLARSQKIDLVIGLGGGSAMDAAKGIALACSGETPIWDYVLNKSRISGPVPALIQVPTLAGTGSELNPIAVFTNWETHEKRFIFHPAVWARTAVIDPELTVTLPPRLTAGGGLDAFAHVVECYLTADRPLPMNDAVREAVMKVVVQVLPQVLAHP